MSGFEHHAAELAQIDHEIRHYAAICQVDLGDRPALDACLQDVHEGWPADKARSTLRGLLLLRLRLEAEMIEQGLTPEPLLPPAGSPPADGAPEAAQDPFPETGKNR